MSTALILLLLLAIASIPGSLVPQRSSNPNGVVEWQRLYPDTQWIIDALQLYDVYSSPWFSAIYLLLFISLVGCVIPRIRHHARALRSAPPLPPRRFERLPSHRLIAFEAATATMDDAAAHLRRRGYRVRQERDQWIAAERGYVKETGNLLFHISLVGIAATYGILGGMGYTGQKILIEGRAFTNVLGAYDSFDPGRWFEGSGLAPFTITLDQFTAAYDTGLNGAPLPIDFEASLTAVDSNGSRPATLKVNEPLDIGGGQVYLLGNGFAPTVTVRDATGAIAFSQSVPFLALDAQLTSRGVIKVPDALPDQLGFVGALYPTAQGSSDGGFESVWPDPLEPVLVLDLYTGDLGLDAGRAQNAYTLDTSDMIQLTGIGTESNSLTIPLGESVALPEGLGSIEFDALPRFIGVDISSDPSQIPTLIACLLATLGLIMSFTSVRRRMWVRRRTDGGIEVAGLARGDDPHLDRSVDALAAAASTDTTSGSVNEGVGGQSS